MASGKTLTHEEVLKRTEQVKSTYPQISIDLSTYTKLGAKCRFVDADFGEWWIAPNWVFRGSVHPIRAKLERRVDLDEVKRRIREINKTYPELSVDDASYKMVSLPCRFVDSEYGSFMATPSNIFKGHVHPRRGQVKSGKNRRISAEEVAQRIKRHWGDAISLDKSTYVDIHTKCRFVDIEHGEFWTHPFTVCSGSGPRARAEETKMLTNLERYGVSYVGQHPDIFSKGQSKMARVLKRRHWKTSKLISCRGSYEYAIVGILNRDKIDYEWQIPFSVKVEGKEAVYYVDFYLPDLHKYIEIKGRPPQQRQMDKWLYFHKHHPNSEIWYSDRVKQFVGKPIHHITRDFSKQLSRKR